MFTVTYEEQNGLVRCTCSGFLTIEDVRAYHAESLKAIARARSAFGHVKMIVQSVDSQVQSPEVMKEVEATMWPMTDPHDRLAVIVSSSLSKMQFSRTIQSPQVQAFLSDSAALLWVMADRHELRAKAS